MGFLDDLQGLELADDVKEKLIQAHQHEVDPLQQSNDKLSSINKMKTVDAEIALLADAGLEDTPGLLKFVRRVYLSANAEEPGAVLLSDSDLELSGEEALGASGREDISVAGAVRKVFELWPRSEDGKLNLGDQIAEPNEDKRPPSGGKDDQESTSDKASRLAGRPIKRTGKRYQRFATSGEGV